MAPFFSTLSPLQLMALSLRENGGNGGLAEETTRSPSLLFPSAAFAHGGAPKNNVDVGGAAVDGSDRGCLSPRNLLLEQRAGVKSRP